MNHNASVEIDSVLEYFKDAEKPAELWKIGLEQELFGFQSDLSKRLSYTGSIRELLTEFTKHFGWAPYFEGNNIIGAKKDGSSITIEPGAQLELSCKPFRTLSEIESFLLEYRGQLQSLSQGKGWSWLSMGYDPFFTPDQVDWVPKERYRVMGEYLPTLGNGAHHMMKTTCTAQSNFDYGSESDMVAKMRVATAFAPFVNILFASSPFSKAQLSGCKSRRGWAWRNMSARHSGFLDFVFDADFGYRRYIDYVLAVPMLVVERDGQTLDLRGADFRSFLQQGYAGVLPVFDDWKVQMGATFPVARLRNAIETRTADAGPIPLLLGQAAFWKGLLYDEQALQWSNKQIENLGPHFFRDIHEQAYCIGFEYLNEHPQADRLLADILETAKTGLIRQGYDESSYLEPVAHIYEQRESVADSLIQGFEKALPFAELFERYGVFFAKS